MISNNIISSVYSPFSDGIGLPLRNIPSSEGLINTIGADFSTTGCPSWRQPHAQVTIIISSVLIVSRFVCLCTAYRCFYNTYNLVFNNPGIEGGGGRVGYSNVMKACFGIYIKPLFDDNSPPPPLVALYGWHTVYCMPS